MTDEELKAIRDRCLKATPGPWFRDYQPPGPGAAVQYREHIITSDGQYVLARPSPAYAGPGRDAREQELRDGQFAAHARSDVPALLAEVYRLRRLLILNAIDPDKE